MHASRMQRHHRGLLERNQEKQQERPQGPYRDERLWELDKSVPGRQWNENNMEYDMGLMHRIEWSEDGCGLMMIKGNAYGMAAFAKRT